MVYMIQRETVEKQKIGGKSAKQNYIERPSQIRIKKMNDDNNNVTNIIAYTSQSTKSRNLKAESCK